MKEIKFLEDAQKAMDEKEIPLDNRSSFPYILVDNYRAMIDDGFLLSVNNEILKIKGIAIPETYISGSGNLVPVFSEKVESALSKLEGLKENHIKEHYQVNKETSLIQQD